MLASVSFLKESGKTAFPNGNSPTRSSCQTFPFAIQLRRGLDGKLIVPEHITKMMLPDHLKELATQQGISVKFYRGQVLEQTISQKPISS